MKKLQFFSIFIVFLLLLFTGCTSNPEDTMKIEENDAKVVNENTEETTNEHSEDTIETEVEKMTNRNVIFKTSMGTFKLEIFEEESPITGGNFIKLVEEGFYDGTRFHRVIKNFMIQGGDPESKNTSKRNMWGTGGPGYAIKDEFIEGLSNKRGTISMANSGPNSGGSQFFINVVDNTFLDWNKAPAQSKHPVFGKVVEGMDVVDKIVNVKTVPGDQPAEDVIIESVTIE